MTDNTILRTKRAEVATELQRGEFADIADEVIADFRAEFGPLELLSVEEFWSRAKPLVDEARRAAAMKEAA